MNNMIEIRWHGRGGQGAKTASQLLAVTASMRDILARFGMNDVSIIQISVSKLNSKNLFESQPAPWIITARAE